MLRKAAFIALLLVLPNCARPNGIADRLGNLNGWTRTTRTNETDEGGRYISIGLRPIDSLQVSRMKLCESLNLGKLGNLTVKVQRAFTDSECQQGSLRFVAESCNFVILNGYVPGLDRNDAEVQGDYIEIRCFQ
jgi:hypothetical protein